MFAGTPVPTENAIAGAQDTVRLEIGVRPEFVSFSEGGIPVEIVKVADAGRYRIVDTRHGDNVIRLLVTDDRPVPSDGAHVHFDPAHTRVYADGWIIT